jgi:TRAP-type C4-dicarboxylate transport system permease small subunit
VSCAALERLATRGTRYLALIGGWLLLGVALVTVSDAVLRDALGRPLPGTFEATELVLALVIFLALPYTSLSDGHVVVDMLTGRLGQRAQAVFISVNALVCATLFGLIALQQATLAAEFLATQRTTITMRLPVAPCLILVSVMAGLTTVAFVVQALAAVRRVWSCALSAPSTPQR